MVRQNRRVSRRIAVAGVTGSGKSTLCRRIAQRWGLPYTEIDSLFHGPHWEPRETFLNDVTTIVSTDSWVIEWQYQAARDAIAARAQTLVWLDPPSSVALFRLVKRTVHRRVNRTELWNGNVEGPLWRALVDRDHIIRWGIRTRRKMPDLVRRAQHDHPDIAIVRLRTPREVDQWLDTLGDAKG